MPAAADCAEKPRRAVLLEAALDYAGRGWPVFPCHWEGERRKRLLIVDWPHAATNDDPEQITAWWRRWPLALIGMPTGRPSGMVVLDIDVKDLRANGYDSLDDLGYAIFDETPMVHTSSGGLHLYFQPPVDRELRNSASKIGTGIDVRGEGGYVIVPSPGSRYTWDPHHNFDTCAPVPVPPVLLPRNPGRLAPAAKPVKPTHGLSAYAEAALDKACRNIMAARAGEQEATLNSECFAIGTLAGAGGIPAEFARRALTWAARQIRDYDPTDPWRTQEIEHKVDRAFNQGLAHPREARRHA